MCGRILGVVLGVMFAAGSATAQTTTAVVLGTVSDQQRAVLPGTTVTARNVETGSEVSEVTDARGRFRVGGLRPGAYEVRVEIQGFATQLRKGVDLFLGQEATIDFELTIASVAETLTVTAASPLVEVTKSEVSNVVDRRQIDALPLAGRNFTDLMRLTPGVVSGDLIGGQQSNTSNTYVIDGVSNDRAWTGGNRTGYTAEAIREFRVITQQYAAEFGQASGGVVNVVTRSGTNAFENRLFVYDRADALDARNFFATTKAPFTRQQFGGFSGGPIRRNRLFYFGAYEGIRQDQTAVVNTPLERADYAQPMRTHQQFGKIDYQIASPHLLTLRFTEERSHTTNNGVGGSSTLSHGSTSTSRSHDFFTGLNSVMGSSRLNELRVQIARRPGDSVPNTPLGPELLFASSSQGKAYSDPQSTTETRFEVVDNLSWHATSGRTGEHDVKAGIDINRESLAGFFCNYCDGQFTFPKDVYDPKDPTTFPTNYTRRVGSSDFTIPDRVYSAFVQDSWRPRSNVTVNAGLRFDRVAYADQLVTNDISPRLAISFDPTDAGKTVVRGGGGLFRDKISLNQWLIIVLNVINATDFVVITNPGYPDPTGGRPAVPGPANTERFDPDMQTPYASQATAGVKRDLGGGFAVSADYLYVRGYDQLRRRDLNAPHDGTTIRPDPTLGRVLIHETTGNRNYHALILDAERRFANRWRFTTAYTLSRSRSDSEARNSTTLPTDQYDLGADWGPADSDARHNFVATGQVTLPFQIQLAGILQIRSAFPFNPVSGRDSNNDSRPGDRPDPNSNGTFPTNGVTEYGRFSIPVNRPGTLSRNAFRGPNFRSADLRLSKLIPIGTRKIELLAEGFNITNRVNFNSYTTSIQSRLFGTPQSAGAARQIQLGARFNF